MPTLNPELEQALAETLLYLKEEEGLVYPEEESRRMMSLYLKLEGPEACNNFLKIDLFMRGQFLAACSDRNKYHFQEEHPSELLSLFGLIHQWTQHPTREASAAFKYRTHTLVP